MVLTPSRPKLACLTLHKICRIVGEHRQPSCSMTANCHGFEASRNYRFQLAACGAKADVLGHLQITVMVYACSSGACKLLFCRAAAGFVSDMSRSQDLAQLASLPNLCRQYSLAED